MAEWARKKEKFNSSFHAPIPGRRRRRQQRGPFFVRTQIQQRLLPKLETRFTKCVDEGIFLFRLNFNTVKKRLGREVAIRFSYVHQPHLWRHRTQWEAVGDSLRPHSPPLDRPPQSTVPFMRRGSQMERSNTYSHVIDRPRESREKVEKRMLNMIVAEGSDYYSWNL